MTYFHTNVLDTQIKELPTVSTASGSIATFDTDMTENLVEVVCDIDSSVSDIIVGYDYKYGGLLDFNQLLQNGNFASGDAWGTTNGTKSVSDNTLAYTVTTVASGNANRIQRPYNINYVLGHKYFISYDIKTPRAQKTSATSYSTSLGITIIPLTIKDTPADSWFTYGTILEGLGTGNGDFRLGFHSSNDTQVGDVSYVKNVFIIDLTQAFGSALADYIYSLEQSETESGVEYARNLLSNAYYDYTLSTIATLGTINNDGTGETFNISLGETVSSGATYEAVSGLLTRSDTTTKKVDNCIIPTNNGNNYVMCNTGDTTVKYLLTVGKAIS